MRICIFGLAAWLAVAVAAGDTSGAGGTLADTVAAFNTEAARDAIGRHEPPLTEDEVVAALRGWIRKRHPVSDDVYKLFQAIAETRQLPEGAELTFTTAWSGYNDLHFDVWWVDLSLSTGQGTGYTYRIRDRKIRSRPLTPVEREQLQQQRNLGAQAEASPRRSNREAVLQTLEILRRQLAALRAELETIENERPLTAAGI
jgi:hypothetical protein